MNTPPATTLTEKISGHLIVQSALTVIAALAGGPLTAMLPVLANSLASERQKERVEKYLLDVSSILQSHEDILRSLTDSQYKLINEAILASLQTTQKEKLGLLRNVVRRSLHQSDIGSQEAILLSRIIRDISFEEAVFVIDNFSYNGVLIGQPGFAQGDKNIMCVPPDTADALLVSGLLSLGVLTPGQPTLGQILRFSSIVAKLIVLLKNDDA